MLNPPPRIKPGRNGYSFLELVIVLAILSALLLLSLPQAQHILNRQETSLFLNRLATDLNYAASEARGKMVNVRIDLLRTQGVYLIKVNGVQKKQVRFPVGMTIKSNFPNDRLDFFSDGQIGQAGTIDVLDSKGKGYSVVIQLSSGRFILREWEP